ncbi:MAG: cation diffusion facilitator family transporter [Acidimicrobiia bacterium]
MTQTYERVSERYAKRLTIALVLVIVYAIVQVVAAFATGSLSLLSDAGHMGTDSLGLAMALAAIVTAARASRGDRRTFGLYRLEILAALANAVLLLGVAGYAIYEGIRRLGAPEDLIAVPLLVVAMGGLAVNVFSAWLLRGGARESLNVEGAYNEVLADLVGSVGVVLVAVIYLTTGWRYADPIVAVGIGLWIVPRALRLGRKALVVLVESAPGHIDLSALRSGLRGIDGVVDVHDLHVWTLTSEMDVATVHLVVTDDSDSHDVLDAARDHLRTTWGLAHATLQVEPESHRECVEETW